MAVAIDDEAVEEAGASGGPEHLEDRIPAQGSHETPLKHFQEGKAGCWLRRSVEPLKNDVRLAEHLVGDEDLPTSLDFTSKSRQTTLQVLLRLASRKRTDVSIPK